MLAFLKTWSLWVLMFSLLGMIGCAISGSNSLLANTGVVLTIVAVSCAMRKWQMVQLQKRIDADNITWELWTSGISSVATPQFKQDGMSLQSTQIGTISDSEYAAMQLRAVVDIRIFNRQLLNIGSGTLQILQSVMILVPALAFWAVLGLGLAAPEGLAEFLQHLPMAVGTEVLSGAKVFAAFALGAALIGLGGTTLFGLRFGFEDKYAGALAGMLHHHCNVPGTGAVELRRPLSNTDTSIGVSPI